MLLEYKQTLTILFSFREIRIFFILFFNRQIEGRFVICSFDDFFAFRQIRYFDKKNVVKIKKDLCWVLSNIDDFFCSWDGLKIPIFWPNFHEISTFNWTEIGIWKFWKTLHVWNVESLLLLRNKSEKTKAQKNGPKCCLTDTNSIPKMKDLL